MPQITAVINLTDDLVVSVLDSGFAAIEFAPEYETNEDMLASAMDEAN